MHVRNFRKMTMHAPAEGSGGAPPSGPGAAAGGDDSGSLVSAADMRAALESERRSSAQKLGQLERDLAADRARLAIRDSMDKIQWVSPQAKKIAQQAFQAAHAIEVGSNGVALAKGPGG